MATRAKGAAWSSFAFALGNGAVVMVVPYLIQAVNFCIQNMKNPQESEIEAV